MLGLPRYVVHGAGGGGNAPSLNFNFVDGSAFSPQITFTRASTATYFDSAGVLQSAAIDAPRLDYDPATLAPRGFLVEEARTNSIRNNTMQGAVAGTPGTSPTNWDVVVSGSGITREIVGTGTEDGITYIDLRFSGTGSSLATPQIRAETTTQVVSAVGQTWTASYYLRVVGGSTTGIGAFQQVWQERDAAGVTLVTTSATITAPTTAALKTQRSSTSRTLTDADTARLTNRIQWAFANGVAVDITLRIGLPQLELGAFATSVIPTTTTALTRSADVASVNTLSPWFNAAEGTLFAEFTPVGAYANARGAVALSNGTTSDFMYIGTRDGSANYGANNRVASGTITAIGSFGAANTSTQKAAFAYANLDQTVTFNGAAVATASLSVPSVSEMNIGARPSSTSSTYLRRITYYPRRLTNAQLQQITT